MYTINPENFHKSLILNPRGYNLLIIINPSVTYILFRPDVKIAKECIRDTIHKMEMSYGTTGSLFRLDNLIMYLIYLSVCLLPMALF